MSYNETVRIGATIGPSPATLCDLTKPFSQCNQLTIRYWHKAFWYSLFFFLVPIREHWCWWQKNRIRHHPNWGSSQDHTLQSENLYHDVDLPHKIFTFKCLSKWLISEENLHHSIFGKIVVELTEIPPFFPERTLQLVDSRKWHLCGILRRSLPLDVRLTVGRGYRVLSWATGEEHPESLKPIFESLGGSKNHQRIKE